MFKIILLGNVEINYVDFGLSIIVVIYYLGYWLRLVYGCCKSNGNKVLNTSTKNPDTSKQHDKLGILSAYFKD
jgi:hypothetical protein